jgi:serine/threonine-protein kinase
MAKSEAATYTPGFAFQVPVSSRSPMPSGSTTSSDSPSPEDDPSRPRPDDSTVDELGDELGATRLLSYHNVLGSPLIPRQPVQAVKEMSWNAQYRMISLLGSGAQGVVYLANREGVDGYSTRVAAKMFLRDEATEIGDYEKEMRRIARQAQKVSELQHVNLLDIRDFVSLDETRVMVMEFVDGLDLRHLLDHATLASLEDKLTPEDWDHFNENIVTRGHDHCCVRPGVALGILRGCLAGLSALHEHDIVHSDLKPANIMIKRTGTVKLIDMDSSSAPQREGRAVIRGTPYYMAPEQLVQHQVRFRSDVASLGYIFIEMLSGRLIFKTCKNLDQLIDAKRSLLGILSDLLPEEFQRNQELVDLCKTMVAFDAANRFPDATAADIGQHGAWSFLRELVNHEGLENFDREIAWWADMASPIR